MSLITRILWSYFFTSTYHDRNTGSFLEYGIFLGSIGKLEEVSIRDVLSFIRSDHRKRTGSQTDSRILLLIDEFTQTKPLIKILNKKKNKNVIFSLDRSTFDEDEKTTGSLFISELCQSVIDGGIDKMIISSLDPFVLNELGTNSGRTIYWIPLRSLIEKQAKQVLLSSEAIDWPKDTLSRCLRAANGHPRSLEYYIWAFNEFQNIQRHSKLSRSLFIELTERAAIRGGYSTAIEDSVVAAGFLGNSIPLESMIGHSKFCDHVANSVFVHSHTAENSFVPRLSGFLLFILIHRKSKSEQNIEFWTCLYNLGKFMITETDTSAGVGGNYFENFHIQFECIKQISRYLCRNLSLNILKWNVIPQFITCSISQHYHLAVPFTNSLQPSE